MTLNFIGATIRAYFFSHYERMGDLQRALQQGF
jgi:hypothetical protein